MAIVRELISQTVVVVAPGLNPSIFSPLWFVGYGFLTEGEISLESSISKDEAAIVSKKFEFFASEDRIQFECPDSDYDGVSVEQSLIPILSRLTDMPFSAFGINFDWVVFEESENQNVGIGRVLFSKDDVDVFAHFAGEDAQFGTYAIREYEGSRLTMEIKPIRFSRWEGDPVRVGFRCEHNFHANVRSEKAWENLLAEMSKFSKFRLYSESLIDSMVASIQKVQ